MSYDEVMLAIIVFGSLLLCASVFSGAVKVFIVNPIICMVKGHKYKTFAELGDGTSLKQCDRCGKCIG